VLSKHGDIKTDGCVEVEAHLHRFLTFGSRRIRVLRFKLGRFVPGN